MKRKVECVRKGHLVILGIGIITAAYLYYICYYLFASTAPDCVSSNGSVQIVWGGWQLAVNCRDLSVNEIGDYFAGLISLLATLWLILAFVWQAMELNFQRREFRASNTIAQSRAVSEDLWRKLEFYDLLRQKLIRTVNEYLVLRSKIDNERKPDTCFTIIDLRRTVNENTDMLDVESYDEIYRSDVERINALIATNVSIEELMKRFEADNDMGEYIKIIQ